MKSGWFPNVFCFIFFLLISYTVNTFYLGSIAAEQTFDTKLLFIRMKIP